MATFFNVTGKRKLKEHLIHTRRSSDKDLGIELPLSKNRSETDIFASDNDLDCGKNHKNKYEDNQFMNLGTETNLQSQSHNRGQTTLGLDFASVSPKQLTSDFSYWDKMSILQITF